MPNLNINANLKNQQYKPIEKEAEQSPGLNADFTSFWDIYQHGGILPGDTYKGKPVKEVRTEDNGTVYVLTFEDGTVGRVSIDIKRGGD